MTYTYDSITGGNEGYGRRTGMTDGSGSSTYLYNVLGQLTNGSQTIDGTTYSGIAPFDAFDRPLTLTSPSGEVFNFSYNAMGALSSLSGTNTYVSQVHYNASGQVTDQLLGNGLLEQSCYDANTLRMTKLRVYSGALQTCGTTPSSPRLNLSFTYQPNGNVSQMVDATRSETLNYTYDELNRLDTVSGAYSLNHDYNPIGNITAKGTTTYTYADTAHKHAVTSLNTGESYTYDANGNMITRVEGGLTYTQIFDAENRLISVTVSGQTTQFIYDGDGNLVKKIKPDGSSTTYGRGIYEVDKNAGGSVTRVVTYYPLGGAMRINSTLYYILKDHLGSASVVTDASGNAVGEQRYYPYGETRVTTGTIFTDQLFTGQREMAGLRIYHYGARFFSPKLGRFLSADTIVPNPANPQDLNRFSYVRNSPLRYTDPTGHRACGDGERWDCDGRLNPTTPTPPPCSTCNPPPGGGGGGGNGGGRPAPVIISPLPPLDSEVSGSGEPLPDDIINILVAQGANQELLDDVNITMNIGGCAENMLAITLGNHIKVCKLVDNDGSTVYDPTKPTPVLVHELVHVRQFRDNYIGTFLENINASILNWLDGDNGNYNPYKDSWPEVEGSNCQRDFAANPGMLLDTSGTCNLQ